jgi:hypothetical protein
MVLVPLNKPMSLFPPETDARRLEMADAIAVTSEPYGKTVCIRQTHIYELVCGWGTQCFWSVVMLLS